jgi:hypothetical protein
MWDKAERVQDARVSSIILQLMDMSEVTTVH